ncbi:hypothetical protein HBI70_136960 [Parastagonospora nodorum]|nr:hypothetical protein HBH43_108960 [Parastagonospora nodorum]KAH4189373.1 hypothetical protein HBH42_142900 [Parastagonospora nodorum]KAH4984569.1 hypothetical protein HBI76_135490 [Parastagonospora nodorum]KAH5029717.1 hypothetical protein HBI75_123950 [Parastagonospora nodorum]KAH5266385.1 hypothetical protein HBI70_136960 [Parastagonospora nodorum]
MRFRSISAVRNTENLHLPFLITKYKYEPLPTPTCIRLLEIAPFAEKNVIRCSLRTFELQHSPNFRALSYTWGESQVKIPQLLKDASHFGGQRRTRRAVEEVEIGPLRKHSIICDGQLIKVTTNLRDAFRMLTNTINIAHTPKTPSFYWIDALCVDQSNVAERNNQVKRMGDVFKKADGVVVWLGKDDEFVHDALKTIRTIASTSDKSWPLVPYTSFYEPEKAPHLNLSFYNWLGFIVLVNRPWFKRAWVVQEIALAKSATVVCGKHVFPWEVLSKALSFVKVTKFYHHLRTEKLRHVATLRKKPGIYRRVLQAKLSVDMGPVYINETRMDISAASQACSKPVVRSPSLRMLLDKHRFSKSSDPRDKVYAFLGLADRTKIPFRHHPSVLIPDYNRSVQDVYTETARVLLNSHKELSLLSHVEDHSSRRIEGLPSWVPDLSVPLDPYPLRFRGSSVWRASGDHYWIPERSRMAEGLLDVHGYMIDNVDRTALLLDESSDPSASWASIVNLTLSLGLPYPSAKINEKKLSRVEILWRTLTTNIYAHKYPAPQAIGSLFIDYIINLQIRHRLMPWSSRDSFQPHHTPLSDSIYPEWQTLLGLEPPNSPYCLAQYKGRLTSMVESMFNGSYSPIGLAQLQHELDQSGGKMRRVFRTRGGYLGTGPRSLRKGDEVWILHRAGLPFVLRPQLNGRYRLVGEAFVYGVMHGEALELDLPRQNITID